MKLRSIVITAVIMFFLMLLDTVLIPAFYQGSFSVPLTGVMVVLISICTGPIWGVFFGALNGLLADIACGSFLHMMCYYGGIAFIDGFLLHTFAESDSEANRRTTRRDMTRHFFNRALCILIVYMIGELVFIGIQYFHSEVLPPIGFLYALIRSLICTVLVVALRPLALKGLYRPTDKAPKSQKEAVQF